MNHYQDKVAIITGGASGIGQALCHELGRRGAIVMVADINMNGAEQVAAEIQTAGGQATAYSLDVSQAQTVQGVVETVTQTHGRLDYMVNNAGIAMGGEIRDMNLEQWQKMIDVNLWGVIYGSMAAYDVMTKQGHGHIVNMGSVSGLVSSPLTAAYTTAKFAVVGFSATLRAEAAAFGVKVNIVCPAFVQTNMHGTSTILNAPREDVLALNPVKKMSPAKAAQIILKGVSRNKKFIVFPFIGRLIWWSYRLNPSVGDLFARRTLKEFRSLRNAYHKQIL